MLLKRGEVWSAATGGGFGGKPRPVLVLQSDAFADAPNIVVVLFTTTMDNDQGVRPRIDPDPDNNLNEPSLAMIDLITTVPRRKFGQFIGLVSQRDLERVDRALLAYLGFSG